MSSFNNRVLVASLFLPTTTASTIHDVHSALAFASDHDPRLGDKITPAPLKPIKEHAPGTSPTSPRSQGFNLSPTAKHRVAIPTSIVDDLTSKVSIWHRSRLLCPTNCATVKATHISQQRAVQRVWNVLQRRHRDQTADITTAARSTRTHGGPRVSVCRRHVDTADADPVWVDPSATIAQTISSLYDHPRHPSHTLGGRAQPECEWQSAQRDRQCRPPVPTRKALDRCIRTKHRRHCSRRVRSL